MIAPTVHLNGTSADALQTQLRDAAVAVKDAIRKVSDAAPNARDYYPQGEGAYAKARAEHESRLERLVAVGRELQELDDAVDDAVRARVRRP